MRKSRLLPLCVLGAVLVTTRCAGKAGPSPESSSPVGTAGISAKDPPSGIYHPLERGLTLYALSRAYGVTVAAIMAANGIDDPASIPAGTPILVPGATKRVHVTPPAAGGEPFFAWPLKGRVTSPFGATGTRKRHTGIDIHGDSGDEIRAAADGRVVRIANGDEYGLLIVVGHEDGHATWYAHASKLLARHGDPVRRGQVIALVGRSGNARGTHLHFEVRRNGAPVDPLPFLEREGRSSGAGGLPGLDENDLQQTTEGIPR